MQVKTTTNHACDKYLDLVWPVTRTPQCWHVELEVNRARLLDTSLLKQPKLKNLIRLSASWSSKSPQSRGLFWKKLSSFNQSRLDWKELKIQRLPSLLLSRFLKLDLVKLFHNYKFTTQPRWNSSTHNSIRHRF